MNKRNDGYHVTTRKERAEERVERSGLETACIPAGVRNEYDLIAALRKERAAKKA